MPDKNSFIVRQGIESDLPFVYASWLKGLRYGNDWFGMIDSEAYFTAYHKVIEHILHSPGVEVKVACLSDDLDVILGYSVSSPNALSWVFVKRPWRNIGIAKALCPSDPSVVTHTTKTAVSILKKHPNVRFNPFHTP